MGMFSFQCWIFGGNPPIFCKSRLFYGLTWLNYSCSKTLKNQVWKDYTKKQLSNAILRSSLCYLKLFHVCRSSEVRNLIILTFLFSGWADMCTYQTGPNINTSTLYTEYSIKWNSPYSKHFGKMRSIGIVSPYSEQNVAADCVHNMENWLYMSITFCTMEPYTLVNITVWMKRIAILHGWKFFTISKVLP